MYAVLITLGILLFWGLTNYKSVLSICGKIADVFKPVFIGIMIAFILNVPMSAIERKFFKVPKKEKYRKLIAKIKRPCSLLITFVICLGVVALLCYLVIPALIATISQLTNDVPVLVTRMNKRISNMPRLAEWMTNLGLEQNEIVSKITKWLKDGVVVLKTINSTVNFATALFNGIINFFLGMFFAIYILAQKEVLKKQCIRFSEAFFPKRISDFVCRICRRIIDTFSKFLGGQTVDACILGTMCGVGMWIFGFPYAPLIGVLVGCTALIPIVGALVGYVVGFMLICTIDFKQAVWFLVFMLACQQIEGNLIYPKVVGSSVGLPSLWTLFAITIGGNLLGIFGMFLAVPVFSVVYDTTGEIIDERQKKKLEAGELVTVTQADDVTDSSPTDTDKSTTKNENA